MSSLPDGWTECFSERRGRVYYFNKRTGESSWERPEHASHESASPVASPLKSPWTQQETTMEIDMMFAEKIDSQVTAARALSDSSSHTDYSLYQQASSEEIGGHERILVFVVDTNIWLSHLSYIQTLLTASSSEVGVFVVIPWVVLQELDGLKGATRDAATSPKDTAEEKDVGYLARQATRTIHELLASGCPYLRGETSAEAHTKVAGFHADTNDDKILHCCLIMQQLATQSHGENGRVALLSGDHNLCIKAFVHNCLALTRAQLPRDYDQLAWVFESARPGAIHPPPPSEAEPADVDQGGPSKDPTPPTTMSKEDFLATGADEPATTPSTGVTQYCVCSKYKGLHMYHAPGETPPPMPDFSGDVDMRDL